MDILAVIVLLALGALLGYGYFSYQKKHSTRFADEDFDDCRAEAKPGDDNKDLVFCYIDKKTKRVKSYLDTLD